MSIHISCILLIRVVWVLTKLEKIGVSASNFLNNLVVQDVNIEIVDTLPSYKDGDS